MAKDPALRLQSAQVIERLSPWTRQAPPPAFWWRPVASPAPSAVSPLAAPSGFPPAVIVPPPVIVPPGARAVRRPHPRGRQRRREGRGGGRRTGERREQQSGQSSRGRSGAAGLGGVDAASLASVRCAGRGDRNVVPCPMAFVAAAIVSLTAVARPGAKNNSRPAATSLRARDAPGERLCTSGVAPERLCQGRGSCAVRRPCP